MIYLVLIWFLCWCLVRLLKTEPAVTVVLLIGMLMALIVVFGLGHVIVR